MTELPWMLSNKFGPSPSALLRKIVKNTWREVKTALPGTRTHRQPSTDTAAEAGSMCVWNIPLWGDDQVVPGPQSCDQWTCTVVKGESQCSHKGCIREASPYKSVCKGSEALRIKAAAHIVGTCCEGFHWEQRPVSGNLKQHSGYYEIIWTKLQFNTVLVIH